MCVAVSLRVSLPENSVRFVKIFTNLSGRLAWFQCYRDIFRVTFESGLRYLFVCFLLALVPEFRSTSLEIDYVVTRMLE